jgi:ABC-type transporter MlaC component
LDLKTRLQQTAKDVAAQVLSEVDAVQGLEKANPRENPQLVARTMEYLTARVYGRPAQTIQGNQQPITI